MATKSRRAAQARARRSSPAAPPPKASRRTPLLIAAALVVAAVLIGGLVLMLQTRGSDDEPALTGVESFEVAQSNHVQVPVAYPQTPPVGGDHAPRWQNCGFYNAPIASEPAVHAMEHGAVWITYRPDLDSAQVEAIRTLAGSQTLVLASPFPNLPVPVVVSAWGRQLRLDSAEDPRLKQFVRRFRVGSQTPEPGAPCTGGIGSPTGIV